jgi:type IV pilus assembly protein PilA
MPRASGFSLIELLITVAIILVIAALAIPSLLNSRMAADESGAAAAIRMLNSAQISYSSVYPSVGYASSLSALGGTNCSPPTSAGACLIDTVLAAGTKSGYSFVLPPASVTGTPASSYQFIATPVLSGYSGLHYFCSYADAVVRRSETTITACDGTITPLN